MSAGRSSRPRRAAGAREGAATRHQPISSPVRRTNTSSRFAGRRSPSGARPSMPSTPSTGDARAGATRAEARRARGLLDLGELRRRAVHLDRLTPRVLGHELRRRAGGHGLPVGHDQHRVGEPLRLLDVVRRHEERRPLGAKRVDQRPQLLAHLGVQPDGRLVEQHEPGAVDESTRDQQAPPHAAGELVDAAVSAIDELGHLQRPLDGVPALGASDPVQVREDEEVLLDRQRDVEVVELRRDAELRARLLRLVGQLEAEHLDLALVRDRLPGEESHRRGLARAVRPEEADARARGHVEVEAGDRGDLPVTLHDATEPDRQLAVHSAILRAALHAALERRAARVDSTQTRPPSSGRPASIQSRFPPAKWRTFV